MDPLFWSIILLIAGLVVFCLEFFLPSAGLLGVTCAALLCSSVVLGFMHSWVTGLVVMILIAMLLPLFFSVGVKVWPHTPLGKRILIGKMNREEVLPDSGKTDELNSLVGQVGIARSKMLPSGMVRINDRSYDAISDGFPIGEGDRVRVIAIRTKRVVVRPLQENEPELIDRAAQDEDLLSRSLEELGIDSLDDSVTE